MKFNAKIFICGLGVCTLLASCKSTSGDYEEATSIAKSTSNMPDWMRESDSLDDGQYSHVADSGIPKVTDNAVYTQESSSSSYKSSSKSTAKSSSKSSKSKATAKTKSSSKKSTAKSSSRSKKSSSYVIQKGDTVEKIARKKGITVKSLMRANNMKNDRIIAGKTLRIP